MSTTLVPHPVAGQATLCDLVARLFAALTATLLAWLRSYGFLPTDSTEGKHWRLPQREEFGADEQTPAEFHAISVQLGEDQEFGRPHGLLIDDTQEFTAVEFADAAPGVAEAYAQISDGGA